MAMFLRWSENEAVAWNFVHTGIRKVQDVGAHKKALYQAQPTIVEEQWKRVFWLFLALDRLTSAALGRPCSIGEEEFVLSPLTIFPFS